MASSLSLLLALVIGLTVYFVNRTDQQRHIQSIKAVLSAEIQTLIQLGTLYDVMAVEVILCTPGQGRTYFYHLRAPQGHIIASTMTDWPKVSEPTGIVRITGESGESFDGVYEMREFADGHTLLIGQKIQTAGIMHGFTQTFTWLVIGICLLLAVGFFIIGRFVVYKANVISSTASEIIRTGDMSKRIPVNATWDDLSKLEEVLNSMLDEIESLVLSIKRVTDDIAHDMRTPLTRLRAELEGVKDQKRRARLLDEADGLLSMFRGILRIAEIENENRKSGFSQVDLGEIVQDAYDLYLPLAEKKGIRVKAEITSCSYLGDRNLLFQSFTNIIDNAIKFSPVKSEITLTMTVRDGVAVFEVKDSGPGIPEEQIQDVFRRLYRVDKSRHTPGHGLGLSIVDAVATLHGAKVHLRNLDQGLCFEMRFALPRDQEATQA